MRAPQELQMGAEVFMGLDPNEGRSMIRERMAAGRCDTRPSRNAVSLDSC